MGFGGGGAGGSVATLTRLGYESLAAPAATLSVNLSEAMDNLIVVYKVIASGNVGVTMTANGVATNTYDSNRTINGVTTANASEAYWRFQNGSADGNSIGRIMITSDLTYSIVTGAARLVSSNTVIQVGHFQDSLAALISSLELGNLGAGSLGAGTFISVAGYNNQA